MGSREIQGIGKRIAKLGVGVPVRQSDPEFEYYLILWELLLLRPKFTWGNPR